MATDRGEYMHHCLTISTDTSIGLRTVELADCYEPLGQPQGPSQIWQVISNTDGSVTIKQGNLCVDNNYRLEPVPPTPPTPPTPTPPPPPSPSGKYVKMPVGQACSGSHEIKSNADCQAASEQFSLKWNPC